ncbi:MAG TPA: DHH family phosphoesterase [Candidatus Avacidaminococcus intestinavium]|uniref:Cyclic-di-AMP phosphodiesterase n=1 Tax=Candidatus Avacidaminococcus intestinavium TaxID=2840684 RepID=A0A9D1MRJ0_9FIRM|nr:DHH family phosphoesterase [Candidatus Avacidaminococcus intestinavium]
MFNKNWNFWSDNRFFIAVICILIIIVGIYERLFLPVGILLLIGVYYLSRKVYKSKEMWFNAYLDTVVRNIERANNYAVQHLPIGIAVFESDGKLQWKNEMFQTWVDGNAEEGMYFKEILPLPENIFEALSNKNIEKQIKINERFFIMTARRIITSESGENSTGIVVYLMDVTEKEQQKKKFDEEQICFANLQFDNYSDVMKGLSESTKATVAVEFNKIISKWSEELNGLFIKYDEDLYSVCFNKAALNEAINHKFDILDKIREIKAGNKIAPTISMGVACEEKSLLLLGQRAQSGLDLALGRGGDQAVVSINGEMQFFGGKNVVQAKSTRVRARIVAQAIHELMLDADKVFVMGHINEDYDSLGAAIGVAKMAFSLSKEAYIVTSGQGYSLEKIKKMAEERDDVYASIIIEGEAALEHITSNSLLILVDHHRPMLSASQEVLNTIAKKVIIDHHRRSEDMIKNSILLYLEPLSSSASELVTELITYFDDRLELDAAEASALYAGLVVDTKNFAVQTGERTFEAAAYLRRNGADPILVRKLFRDEQATVMQRARLVADARMPLPGLAVSIYKNAPLHDTTQIILAQAADELVAMNEINVSVVMAETEDELLVSARSDGSINVQIIMEELGGGGHQTVAGLQLKGVKAEDIEPQIIELTKKQFEEIDTNESNIIARS